MTIYAIIPVHNRIELTLQFLDSLDAQVIEEEVTVLVVDDGSTDGTREILRERTGRFPVEIIQGDGKLWWAGSVKRAIATVSDSIQTTDWIYLGNNDTVLSSNHFHFLVETARTYPVSIVGARSLEIWPDGSFHGVSSGFEIDPRTLRISAMRGDLAHVNEADGLCARGILLPSSALKCLALFPRVTPQHFADLSMTTDLRRKGFRLLVDYRAESLQTARASSAQELGRRNRPSFRRRDPLYVPALLWFWWHETSWLDRALLPLRLFKRT